MAPHSSALAWKIPWMEEPGRLQSRGLLRVRHDRATSLSLFTFMHWRRKWQPTPVFLPGESQGRGSLVGCRLWGRTESDTTEVTQQQQQQSGIGGRRVGKERASAHRVENSWSLCFLNFEILGGRVQSPTAQVQEWNDFKSPGLRRRFSFHTGAMVHFKTKQIF